MAIFFLNVFDDLAAPVLTKVDVKVRHRHTFRVQKTFEQQRETKRIKVGDQKRIGHERARTRTTARPDGDFMILGPLDEVGNDQEVTWEAHLVDDAKFIIKAFPIGLGDFFLFRIRHFVGKDIFFETAFQAFFGHMAEFIDLCAAFSAIKRRQDRVDLFNVPRAALGDQKRIIAGLGNIGEQVAHFSSRLEPMVRGEFPTIFLTNNGPLPDANKHVMGFIHIDRREIAVIGRNQRHIMIIGQLDQAGFDLFFKRLTMALQFNIKAIAKDILEVCHAAFGLIDLLFTQ